MTSDQEKFAGGVAVITGAGSGIGAGLARRAGELGMTVVVADIVTPKAESVAEEIRSAGGKAEVMTVDVSRPAELDRLAAEVFDRHGEVRLLINNAGIETLGLTWDIPLERWEATLNINIHGVVHGVRAFVPYMLKAGKEAWIGNLSSVGGFGIMPTQSAYTMTKHAVQAFSEGLYLEMEISNSPIHVSSIIPGMVKTEIFAANAGAGEPENAARHRTVMRELMQNYGMELAEGCQRILAQMADNKFWVSTQPEMTEEIVGARIEFLRTKQNPVLGDAQKQLLGIS